MLTVFNSLIATYKKPEFSIKKSKICIHLFNITDMN